MKKSIMWAIAIGLLVVGASVYYFGLPASVSDTTANFPDSVSGPTGSQGGPTKPLLNQGSAATKDPVISQVITVRGGNQFSPGEEVTLIGSNFPVTGRSVPNVWIGSVKISGVTGIKSATANKIVFTVPALSIGNYDLFLSGMVGVQTADPASSGTEVKSNSVRVVVR